ncbi:hypothetical protein HRbin23_00439 [bacterium HR23]|nr:hypothetical protein HRbin23_00439 [bacterium HR23]
MGEVLHPLDDRGAGVAHHRTALVHHGALLHHHTPPAQQVLEGLGGVGVQQEKGPPPALEPPEEDVPLVLQEVPLGAGDDQNRRVLRHFPRLGEVQSLDAVVVVDQATGGEPEALAILLHIGDVPLVVAREEVDHLLLGAGNDEQGAGKVLLRNRRHLNDMSALALLAFKDHGGILAHPHLPRLRGLRLRVHKLVGELLVRAPGELEQKVIGALAVLGLVGTGGDKESDRPHGLGQSLQHLEGLGGQGELFGGGGIQALGAAKTDEP